jgi:hypothetical protein
MRALDAEFGYLAMDRKPRRAVKRASQHKPAGGSPLTYTFNVEELLEKLDEIRVQKVVDAHFGSQWNVSPMFIRRAKVV